MFELEKLSFNQDALEPVISKNTVSFHYDKHHKTYVDNLNKLIDGTDFKNTSLDDIVVNTTGVKEFQLIFNNAAQIWNHDFYWKSIAPISMNNISSDLNLKISDFGGIDFIKSEIKKIGLSQFGSGWVWVVLNKETSKLEVLKTLNADIPNNTQYVPLLTIDVWEHAYYLDYQNKRGDYLDAIIEVLNWEFASNNFSKC